MTYTQEKHLAIDDSRCKRMSLKWYFQNNTFMCSPQICTRCQLKRNSEASFCTCEKASLTVEAAIVVPITLGFLVTILFLFRMIEVQAIVEEAMVSVGQKVAVEACLFESEEQVHLLTKGLLISALAKSEKVETYIEGGCLGVYLLGSEINEHEIVLELNYGLRLPVAFFEIKSIPMRSQNRFVRWNGDCAGKEEEEWVYITPTGEVFHATSLCRTLDLSIEKIAWTEISNIRGKNGQKYYPCSRCIAKNEKVGTVYYTEYGSLYHGTVVCSALKRTIIKIARSKVQERRGCSYCYP